MSNIKMCDAVLECNNLYKNYHDGNNIIKVLENINLSIMAGEQIAVMGRSGSGKTTFLQMIGGLDNPTSGEIRIQGKNLLTLKEQELATLRNQALGFIYQMHHLLPEFTALENVAMPLLIANQSASHARVTAASILNQVGLQHRLNHRPSELSGGERQRVAIARALVNSPQCVLADEPTGNLDEFNASQVFEIMQSLNRAKKTSLLMVTHDPSLAKKMDKILILQNGRLLENT